VTQRIENKIKPEIFDEKRGIAALLIKNFRFYFVRDPKIRAVKEEEKRHVSHDSSYVEPIGWTMDAFAKEAFLSTD